MADFEKFNRRWRRGIRRCVRVAFRDVPDAEVSYSLVENLIKAELSEMIDSGEIDMRFTDDEIILKKGSL